MKVAWCEPVDRLGRVLPRVLAKQRRASLLTEYRVRHTVREVLGEDLSAECEVIEVRGPAVWITTANPALAHQLRLDAEPLVARVNAVTNLPRPIRSINVRVGGGGRGGRSA